jgi:hypothetical protein
LITKPKENIQMASKDNFKAPTPPPGYVLTDEYPEVGWKLLDDEGDWCPIYTVSPDRCDYTPKEALYFRYIAKPIPVPEGYRLATEEEAKAHPEGRRYSLKSGWRAVNQRITCFGFTDTYAVPIEPVKPLRVNAQVEMTPWGTPFVQLPKGKFSGGQGVTVEPIEEVQG